ncbi:hypothetical protein GALMADRAFT_379183 [Galerina marginata CBS 339.88]|uniref:Uncharacterized protein n=1 Tax=Galerina marginata (strain CBS 339.88) TaxID=685588 RepID=A0A067U2Q6_GALM3|nr:hypothetical protein GALMADRAFT_379183 [Galerina marginata CBS 339.88]
MQSGEVTPPTSEAPPLLIRLVAQATTALYFIESVGTTFILWLCPSLAPEPRIHHYVSSSPSVHHHHHHHHHHHILRERTKANFEDPDICSSVSEESVAALEDLKQVDKALEEEQVELGLAHRQK